MKTPVLIGSLTLAGIALGQTNRTVELYTPRVPNNLATIKLKMKQSAYTKGESVEVTVRLIAGKHGAYFPNYFGDWLATCEHGFSAEVFDEKGNLGDPTPRGCVGGGIRSTPGIDTAQTELQNFIRLKPGESRTWHTRLSTSALNAGKYSVVADYMSNAYMIHEREVSNLPQVNGTVAMGHITTKPARIQIR